MTAAGLAVAVGLFAVTDANAQKRVRWKLHSAWGSSVPHLGTSAVRYSKNIERLSGGKFTMKFFEPGALIPANEGFDATSKGSLESAWTTAGYDVIYVTAAMLDDPVGFLAEIRAAFRRGSRAEWC